MAQALKGTAEAVHAVLRGEIAVEEGASRLGVDATRLSIYRDFVHGHIVGVLAKDFPATKSVLEPAVWDELVEAYDGGACDVVAGNRLFLAFLATLLVDGIEGQQIHADVLTRRVSGG